MDELDSINQTITGAVLMIQGWLLLGFATRTVLHSSRDLVPQTLAIVYAAGFASVVLGLGLFGWLW